MGAVTIGLDVGQRRDPTALAVVELDRRERTESVEVAIIGGRRFLEPRTHTDEHYLVRHLERLPLGTSYPDVARRVASVAAGVRERTKDSPVLYVDATGVGIPLVDVLRANGVTARLVPCFFTHGDRRTQEKGEVKIGKAWLVSRMQALLQSGHVHLPKTDEAKALADELLNYEIKVDEDANDRYGAFKTGTHDDLVTALGLAVQPVQRWGVAGVVTYAGSGSGGAWGAV